MEYNNLNLLDSFLKQEADIKQKYNEIERLYKNREELRKGCSDNIVVCVSKYPYFMGKDQFSRDKNICLICGKEVNLIKEDTIFIDMSSYNTGFSDVKEDIDYKLFYVRHKYIEIIKENPNINQENLTNELNKAIIKNDSEKVLEKKMN